MVDNNEDERWMDVLEDEDDDEEQVNNEDEDNPVAQADIDEDEDDDPPVVAEGEQGEQQQDDDTNNNIVNNNDGDYRHTLEAIVSGIINIYAIVISHALSQALLRGHYNTIRFVLLLLRAIELHPRDPTGGRGRGGETLAQRRLRWMKPFLFRYTLYTPLNKSPASLLGEVVQDTAIDTAILDALDNCLIPARRDAHMEKIRAAARKEEENGNTRIRDLMNEIKPGLTEHSTSLPSDNLGGGGGGLHYDDPIDPFQNHDAGATNNNNSNNKWWKTLYFMFGLVSVLGLIGLGSIATSHCTLDIRCKFTREPGSNNIISSIPSRFISSLINNEQGEGGTIGNNFIGITSSVVDLDGTEEISLHLDFSYVNDKLKDMGAWVGKHLTSIKEAWKEYEVWSSITDFSNATYHVSLDYICSGTTEIVSPQSTDEKVVKSQLLYLTLDILHRTKTVVSKKEDRIKSLESKLQIMTESETSLEVEVNSLKKSVEAGKVLQTELRRKNTDLNDRLNGTEMTLNNMTLENEQLKGGLADAQDELGRYKKKAEQQQQVIQGVEAEKDEMEKTNTGDIRKLQDTVTRYETEAARQRERIATLETNEAHQQATIQSLEDTVKRYETEAARQQATIESLKVHNQRLRYAAAGMICLILGISIYRTTRSSDDTASLIKGGVRGDDGVQRVGLDVPNDSVVDNPSPPEDSSYAVDQPSPHDEYKPLAESSKVSTTSAAEGLVDISSEGVTDTDAAAADVSGSEGVSSSNNESLSATQGLVDSVSDSSTAEGAEDVSVLEDVSGSVNEPKTLDTSPIEELAEEDGSSSAAERVSSSDNVPLDSDSSSTIGHSSSAIVLFGGDASQGSSSGAQGDVVPVLNGGTSNSSSANTEATHPASDEDKKENVPPRRQVLSDGCDVYKGQKYPSGVLGDSQK